MDKKNSQKGSINSFSTKTKEKDNIHDNFIGKKGLFFHTLVTSSTETLKDPVLCRFPSVKLLKDICLSSLSTYQWCHWNSIHFLYIWQRFIASIWIKTWAVILQRREETLARPMRHEGIIKRALIGKEEVKISPFADDMIVYLKNAKNSTRKLLEMIRVSGMWQNTKFT